MAAKTKLSERAQAIYERLSEAYPQTDCPLNHTNAFELLVATILSAQCRDERVNQVTPGVFAKYPTPQAMAEAPLEELTQTVRSISYPNSKAKNLQAMSRALVETFGGEVPSTLEELTQLPGVGRKTANVILGHCFGQPGITVDTHVNRVTRRLGLTQNSDPEKIERDLMALIPQKEWTDFSLRVIFHGRAICEARKPLCEQCVVSDLCDYYAQLQSGASPKRGK